MCREHRARHAAAWCRVLASEAAVHSKNQELALFS